ncbi:MAG: DUF1854 domain-containing protein [Lentisphaeria bacterium]|nr:DUF1854 domain-containing protein [Lentisphaeria bacterium]
MKELTPDTLTFAVAADNTLSLTLAADGHYESVYCQPLFPITRPEEYIAVFHTQTGQRKSVSLGVIRALADLPPDQRDIVRDDLRLAHFLPAITIVKSVKATAKGHHWDVTTDRGEKTFMVSHSGDHAVVTIQGVIIITDTHGFRYRISDMSKLDRKSRAELVKAQL